MDDVTRILDAAESGDTQAAEALLPLVYAEFRQIAGNKMMGERDGHTLQPTARVHEADLRLTGKDGEQRSWKNRKHLLAAAAEAMRRVLIDRARRRLTSKRGGDQIRTSWDESKFESGVPTDEVLAVDEALQKLEVESPELADIVKLRDFAEMTMEETLRCP
jgi:RNA polymerase sigma factor (TIGR02999 family)